ncbi:MAG: bifunctional diaminohydroxyphosphoribosylaminopyrimidine deaminase/5-amino-6-(5-phosphoribosylamino)uracil reductase RibD [Candidatus Omnitrophota bacterium]|jgi:diaminohydroxyphosphoribosylaminopyrimidine deaminase/5-amino-6-(5-phosphoribosylamino)uracil reductase
MNIDQEYMHIAIKLAKKAEGRTSPNPIVGALVVNGSQIVGRGYHKKAGLAHAEVNALKEAGRQARNATLYVTLEPCDHFGRTPPCTDAIVNSRIRRVVIGMTDPNPLNNGRGIKRLAAHGISVVSGVLEKEARSINEPYIKFITRKLPYVTVKAAESIDGKIATRLGDSKWITSDDSRRYVHELRSRVDAVMVGVNTVLRDDPLLTSRIRGAKQPLRIVVDSHLKTPLNAKLFANIRRSPLLIVAIERSPRIKKYESKGAEILIVKEKRGKVDLARLMKSLAVRGISHILVEGGGELNAAMIDSGLADKVLFFIAPMIIGGKDAITAVEGRGAAHISEALALKNVKVKRFSEDILIEGEVR